MMRTFAQTVAAVEVQRLYLLVLFHDNHIFFARRKIVTFLSG